MLSGDAAMDAVVPFVCHDVLNTCVTDVCQNTTDVQSMEKLKHDGGIDIDILIYVQKKLKNYTKTTVGQHHQLPEY